jgi:hypothetical protein
MVFRFTILGYEVWRLELTFTPDDADDEDDGPSLIGGGETHNFERDTNPLNPADHYGEWEDRHRSFGFR